MTESRFWTKIRDQFRSAHWTRIENEIGVGAPDVNGSWQNREVWAELKIIHSGKITIRISQLNWMQARLMAGSSNALVLAWQDGQRTHGYVKRPERICLWYARTIVAAWTLVKRSGDYKMGKAGDRVTFWPGTPDLEWETGIDDPHMWQGIFYGLFPPVRYDQAKVLTKDR